MRRVWMVWIAALVLALLPVGLRTMHGDPALPGEHTVRALLGATQGATDPASLLMRVGIVLGTPWLMPALVASVIAVLLMVLVARALDEPLAGVLGAVAFLCTPAFMVAGSEPSAHAIGLMLALAALLVDTRVGMPLTLLVFAISPVMGAAALLCIAYRYAHRGTWAIAGGLLTVCVILLMVLMRISWRVPISELGAVGGISVFMLVIAAYGWSVMPRRDHGIVLVLLTTFAVLAFDGGALLGSVVLAFLMGIAVRDLSRRRWLLEPLRQSLVVLIICCGMFLLITSTRARVDAAPDAQLVQVLQGIAEGDAGNVLSVPSDAAFIRWYAGREPTWEWDDGTTLQAISTRDATRVYDFLERTGTRYIIISDEMVRLMPRTDDGIMFVLPNSQRFVRIATSPHLSVWFYIPREER